MLLKYCIALTVLLLPCKFATCQSLDDALDKKDTALAAKIISQGYNLDSLNKDGTSILIGACRYTADTLIASFLLQHGAKADYPRSPKGRTALIVACAYYGGVPLCRVLLNAGSDVNAVTKDGVTALMLAASNNKVDVVEYLLSRGANPLFKDAGGKTALDYAHASQLSEDVKKMMTCCQVGKQETVNVLLKAMQH